MARKKGGKAAPKKNPYKRPPPIAKGDVIKDSLTNKTWTIGEVVGSGGFGDIYSACINEGPDKGDYKYVIKVEPMENGPLFVEKHFYIRNAKETDIKEYMTSKKMKSFGMPPYFGHGFHENNDAKYRYLVLERYGTNIWEYFEKCNKSFSSDTVFLLGLQMLEVLEYIHGRSYVHMDIKAGNILMGRNKGSENQAYLVDYGLASRITSTEYKEDAKAAHDGTLEYISRDGHRGGHTMRGDLEILAYNMLHWLTGTLPWLKSTYQANTVHSMKEDFMKDVRNNIKKIYPQVPDTLIQFFEYINTLEPMDVPNFKKCEKMFLNYLKTLGKNRNSKLEFKSNNDVANNNESVIPETIEVVDKKQGRKRKAKDEKVKSPDQVVGVANKEAEERNADKEETGVKKRNKRKATEPKVITPKKFKGTQVATPPVKDNYANVSTQIRQSPRIVGKKKVHYSDKSEQEDSDSDDIYIKQKKKPQLSKRKLLPKNKVTRKNELTEEENDNIEFEENVLSDPIEDKPEDVHGEVKNKTKDNRKLLSKMKETVTKEVRKRQKKQVTKEEDNGNTESEENLSDSIEDKSNDIHGEQKNKSKRKLLSKKDLTKAKKDNGSVEFEVNDPSNPIEDNNEETETKPKNKRKLLSKTELIVTKVVRKKDTVAKKPKWNDKPTIVNGMATQK